MNQQLPNKFKITAKVWLYPGKAAWHFVSIPNPLYEEINELFADQKRGWGSLPVEVTIGKTTWETSIFPDLKSSSFLLPIKKTVRQAEKMSEDSIVSIKFLIKV